MTHAAQTNAELSNRVVRALATLDVYTIQAMERDELVDLQRALGYGETWGFGLHRKNGALSTTIARATSSAIPLALWMAIGFG